MIQLRLGITLVILLTLLFLAIRSGRKLPVSFGFVALYALLNVITIAVSHLAAKTMKTNLWVFHFYQMAVIITISLLYYHLFKQPRDRFLSLLFGIVLLIFSVYNTMFIQKLNELPTYSISFTGILYSFLGLLFFKRLIEIDTQKAAHKNPYLLLNLAFLIFHIFTAIIWAFYNVSIQNALSTTSINIANFVVNLIVLIILLYATALVTRRRYDES